MSFKEKIAALKKKTAQVYVCMKSPEMPIYAKIMAGLTIAYALSPIDLIPDFIPVLGYIDDMLLLPLMIFLTVKMIPEKLWLSSEEEAEKLWENWKNGKPKKWIYALPIMLIWAWVIAVIAYKIIK